MEKELKTIRPNILILGIIGVILLSIFILPTRPATAQIVPPYPPVFFPFEGFPLLPPPGVAPVFYGYLPYSYPATRSASVLSSTSSLLLSTLLTPTTTTTATPVIGVSTAITLATLGGSGLSTTTLATLAATPVPTTVTTTPTIGTTTALLLSGGVSTSTLLLLGI
ncbi:MAG: hypothetical protein K6U11_11850 [bacterium]|nr:hypothetical protein [bacterium]